MVDIVSGSGIARIISGNEVQEDRVHRMNIARAADAAERRKELAVGAIQRGADQAGNVRAVRAETVDREIPGDSPNRFPRLAQFLDNPESVTRILEDTQGVDRVPTAAERLQQAAVIDDSLRRSVFISMIDPGRAMTVLGTRETYGLEDDS